MAGCVLTFVSVSFPCRALRVIPLSHPGEQRQYDYEPAAFGLEYIRGREQKKEKKNKCTQASPPIEPRQMSLLGGLIAQSDTKKLRKSVTGSYANYDTHHQTLTLSKCLSNCGCASNLGSIIHIK